jgi:excisionase family DNA binding protein
MTGHSSEPPLVYKAEQVSELLGLGLNQVYEGIKRGEIPSCRVGRRILVPRKRLLDMLNGGGTDATTR